MTEPRNSSMLKMIYRYDRCGRKTTHFTNMCASKSFLFIFLILQCAQLYQLELKLATYVGYFCQGGYNGGQQW